MAAVSADAPGREARLSEVEADAIERAEAAPAGGRSLVVQVWLGEVGVPAAGAEVFVMEQRGAASFPDVEDRGARLVAPPISGFQDGGEWAATDELTLQAKGGGRSEGLLLKIVATAAGGGGAWGRLFAGIRGRRRRASQAS